MKASELRIGNWFYNNNGEGIKCQIQHLVFCDSIECKYNPIPLTPEWLEKFGFESEDVDDYVKDNHSVIIEKKEYSYWFAEQASDVYWQQLAVIKYVHQLQNLYFALTGEELEINDTE